MENLNTQDNMKPQIRNQTPKQRREPDQFPDIDIPM